VKAAVDLSVASRRDQGICMTIKLKPTRAAIGGGKLHSLIARGIGERILGGEFAPGTLLPNEAEWGRIYNASRTAIREAIKSLAAKGLIASRPKIGSRVEPKMRWNLLDRDVLAWHRSATDRKAFLISTQEFRRIVEPGIAELAAKKRTTDQIDDLVSALDDMREAKTHAEMVAADVLFHEALLSASNNDLLVPFNILIDETLANLFDFTTQRNPSYRQAIKLHEAIARAVIAAEPANARKAMLALLDDTDHVVAMAGKRRPV
jgi:DNA-binding FadR family transcriptional regulator